MAKNVRKIIIYNPLTAFSYAIEETFLESRVKQKMCACVFNCAVEQVSVQVSE